jgi:hypothetical protein
MPTGLWPFRPAPFADELLTSWIARLAHGHGLRPAGLLQILEPACPEFAALDWKASRQVLALLAGHTGVSHSAIESLGLRLGSDPNLRDLLHDNWQGPALQYCGVCLAEGVPYYRRSWGWRASASVPNTVPHYGESLEAHRRHQRQLQLPIRECRAMPGIVTWTTVMLMTRPSDVSAVAEARPVPLLACLVRQRSLQ